MVNPDVSTVFCSIRMKCCDLQKKRKREVGARETVQQVWPLSPGMVPQVSRRQERSFKYRARVILNTTGMTQTNKMTKLRDWGLEINSTGGKADYLCSGPSLPYGPWVSPQEWSLSTRSKPWALLGMAQVSLPPTPAPLKTTRIELVRL